MKTHPITWEVGNMREHPFQTDVAPDIKKESMSLETFLEKSPVLRSVIKEESYREILRKYGSNLYTDDECFISIVEDFLKEDMETKFKDRVNDFKCLVKAFNEVKSTATATLV